jgi:divalent metal cation (Fe/Co/Zn/Cd) transporter
MASMAVATLLAGLKLWAVISTHSTAMLGSLADTGLDLVASAATLLGYGSRRSRPITTTASGTARPKRSPRCSRSC